jgi:hypothetical protein
LKAIWKRYDMSDWEIPGWLVVIGFFICWWKFPSVAAFLVVLVFFLGFILGGVGLISSGDLISIILGLISVAIGILLARAFISDLKQ